MELTVCSMPSDVAREICTWHYEEPYSFYDMDADPDDRSQFLDPPEGVEEFSVVDAAQELIGFYTFVRSEGWVELGLGLRPDLTGRGTGEAFVRQAVAFARSRYHAEGIRLAVASFNVRAITVYERAGFREVRRAIRETNGGLFEFVEMELPTNAAAP